LTFSAVASLLIFCDNVSLLAVTTSELSAAGTGWALAASEDSVSSSVDFSTDFVFSTGSSTESDNVD
jgi:hypothetical protein